MGPRFVEQGAVSDSRSEGSCRVSLESCGGEECDVSEGDSESAELSRGV